MTLNGEIMKRCMICRGPWRWNKTIVDDPLYWGPFGSRIKYDDTIYDANKICYDCYLTAFKLRNKKQRTPAGPVIKRDPSKVFTKYETDSEATSDIKPRTFRNRTVYKVRIKQEKENEEENKL